MVPFWVSINKIFGMQMLCKPAIHNDKVFFRGGYALRCYVNQQGEDGQDLFCGRGGHCNQGAVLSIVEETGMDGGNPPVSLIG